MFRPTSTFSADISTCDVSNVMDMDGKFADANLFNVDISEWNMSIIITICSLVLGHSILISANGKM